MGQRKITEYIAGDSRDRLRDEYMECRASAISIGLCQELAEKVCCEKILMKHGRLPGSLVFCRKLIGDW